jgi:hypothetical protein
MFCMPVEEMLTQSFAELRSVMTDSDASLRASDRNPLIYHRPPPPRADPPRADDAPMHYFDAEFEEQDRSWRDEEVQSEYVTLAQADEHGVEDREDEVIYTCRSCRRRRRRGPGDGTITDECVGWMGMSLLACIVVTAFAVASVLVWVLVTQ